MISSNECDFKNLIRKLTEMGWMFENEYPSQDIMDCWQSLGRTTKPMIYYRIIKNVKRKRYLYLIRGKRAQVVVKYIGTISTVGEWNGWYADSKT
jgi:hypothetical protein